MTAIIHRGALVFHGHNPAPDVAMIVSDHLGRHVITLEEVMEKRRERQRWRLENNRRGEEEWRAWRLYVAYFDQDMFGGWQAMLDNFKGPQSWDSTWIDRDAKGLKEPLMQMFPFLVTDWWEWKPLFAKQYERRRQDGQPVGVRYLWWKGRGEFKHA